ncbi:hypothetical protein LPJ63_004051 [Coemansia sp. RSA 2711]|nr:hypothetical protein LPJ63_004051 [Coemansia sp. RSA 2711]
MQSPGPGSRARGKGCPHIAAKTKAILERLKVLVPYANVCRHRQALLLGRRGAGGAREATGSGDGDRSRKRLVDELPAPACGACGTAGDRLHACLGCDEFACWRARARRGGQAAHIAQHLAATGHAFALDFVHVQLFCGACGDYVYDGAVQAALAAAQIRWHAALCDSAEPEAKRPRIVSAGADLSPAQARYLREHGAVTACTGVRGLHNLGATCYLSVVLQALVHNPVVRGWMLSDGHHPRRCRVGRAPTPGSDSGGDDEVVLSGGRAAQAACMACELEAAFQAVFGGERAPFAPVGLLRALWVLRGDLAGYGQQDAHECLGAVLDALHVGFTENAARPVQHSHTAPCPCLVHQAFAGVLQSTVTCARCGNATHAHDPILDISLDIPGAAGRAEPSRTESTPYSLRPRHSRAARAADAALGEWLAARRGGACATAPSQGAHPVVTLQDCLAHYTRAERLAPGAYTCSRCRATDAAATKQLCIKELPPVLTFQLKRFGAAAKLDAFVRLPLTVDMTPYTASAQAAHAQALGGLRASAGAATTSTGSALPGRIADIAVRGADDAPRDAPVPVLDGPGGSTTLGKRRTDATHSNPACCYRLFAVIDHVGALDSGHYTAYALHRNQWYLFDDARVTRVAVRDVLAFADEARVRAGRPAKGSAYMAFYVKSILDYHDSPAAPAASPAGMGAGNTRINASGEWVEDAGVVRTRINPNGDVKIERRGRKKGSTNAPKPKPPLSTPLASLASPMSALTARSDSDSDDGEALWSQFSKDPPPTSALKGDRPLFSPADASEPDKPALTPAAPSLNDDIDDDDSDSDFPA